MRLVSVNCNKKTSVIMRYCCSLYKDLELRLGQEEPLMMQLNRSHQHLKQQLDLAAVGHGPERRVKDILQQWSELRVRIVCEDGPAGSNPSVTPLAAAVNTPGTVTDT